MNRSIHVSETGSYGIHDDDINTAGVWSNEETGTHSMGGSQIVVQTEVLTTALGDANDAPGGLKTTDMGVEAQVDRRESIRAPRGFDDPEMDPESFDLATEERIRGEAEADRRSTQLAERYEAVTEEAEDFPSRAERCRQELTAMETPYQQTTSDERPETETNQNPWGDLEQEELAQVNKSANRLADHFGAECAMGRASMSKCLARRVANGQSPTTAMFDLKETIERFPEVRQPIANIDPFDQYQTTIVGTIDVLWSPKGKGQRQVGLISDETNEPVKITVWHRSGDKPTLREGDKVRVVRGKVNAYQKGGQWQTTIAVDADAEIHHIEHGDGDAPRQKKSQEEPTIPAWRADSKTHAWHNGADREQVVEATLSD